MKIIGEGEEEQLWASELNIDGERRIQPRALKSALIRGGSVLIAAIRPQPQHRSEKPEPGVRLFPLLIDGMGASQTLRPSAV